jgi:hypothetical protein
MAGGWSLSKHHAGTGSNGILRRGPERPGLNRPVYLGLATASSYRCDSWRTTTRRTRLRGWSRLQSVWPAAFVLVLTVRRPPAPSLQPTPAGAH